MFAYEPDEKKPADAALAKANLWNQVNALLRNITVCDPACGSGSFLVGMLMVLDDLQARANNQLGVAETMYNRRKRIIGQSLYGVDVMDWAVHTAELRLWLQLMIETDLRPENMKWSPLLPNLSFKLRVGDSLVQQFGNIVFNLDREHLNIPTPLKGKLTALKGEKMKFYNNDAERKYRTKEQLGKAELDIFREILNSRADELQKRIRELTRDIESPPEQLTFLDEKPKAQQLKLLVEEWRAERDRLQSELDEIQDARGALRTAKDIPFVWDIAFVEIFEGEEKGFDIVIGNPPYVRQEKIAPPLLNEEDYDADEWRAKKKAYKEQLQLAVAEAYPRFFDYKRGSNKFRKLDGKSDLYVYFYFLGLRRLNSRGSFCFITSNSWLDVGYGKDLQEFLLENCTVKMILDNEKKRSFAQADVNTVIALLSCPTAVNKMSNRIARFVMFKTPFENALSPMIFEEVESATDRKSTLEYRVAPMGHGELLAEGTALPETVDDTQGTAIAATAKYEGGKWGGRYLRAPDIFYVILQKGKGKLFRLSNIADVRRGFTTGVNDFFYLNDDKIQQWRIESRFLKPVIKTPREVSTIFVPPSTISTKVFICGLPKKQLQGTRALQYIEWGEKQKSRGRQKQSAGIPWPKLATVQGREYWYSLNLNKPSDFFCNRFFNERFFFSYSNGIMEDQTFYGGFFTNQQIPIEDQVAFLNSTIVYLTASLLGRVALGEGVLQYAVYEMLQLLVLSAAAFPSTIRSSVIKPFQKLRMREILPVEQEILQPDRRALDDIIFDALGLTRGEREAVYEAVVDLVRKRLEKAGSV